MKRVAVHLDDALWAAAARVLRVDIRVPVGERGRYHRDASFGLWLFVGSVLALAFAVTGPRIWAGAVLKGAVLAVPLSMVLLRGSYDAIGRTVRYTHGGWPWLCSYVAAWAAGVVAFQP